jgi:3-hydroxyacyl-[acyl-carrier-protein] dehydratase
MANIVEAKDILTLLPHRYPFLLVDRVEDYEAFKFINAIKNVTINEPFFQGHFPGIPVMPGVLMLEALAQASAVLSNLSRSPKEGHKFLYYFAGLDNVKFKQVVEPGDQLKLKINTMNIKRDFWRMHGDVLVGETIVCSADLLSAAKEIPL